MAGSADLVEHLVYSDGVASVSVFVEPSGKKKDDLAGASRIGAANAYTAEIDGHQVTAVGEVPTDTVRMIARSMQRDHSAIASQ
jgi:sigma-E factor negative regulatory protein RseB